MPNRYKKPCDLPSEVEKIVTRKLIDLAVDHPDTLTQEWIELAPHIKDRIDTISRAYYPGPEQQDERQAMTRGLVLFASLTPDKYDFVATFENAFKLNSPEGHPPESVT